MSSIVVSELAYAPPGADQLFFDIGFGVAPGEHVALVAAERALADGSDDGMRYAEALADWGDHGGY